MTYLSETSTVLLSVTSPVPGGFVYTRLKSVSGAQASQCSVFCMAAVGFDFFFAFVCVCLCVCVCVCVCE